MAKQRFFNLISKISYLHSLTPLQQMQVFEMASRHIYGSNEMIFLEGERATGLWLIESGQVKIAKMHPDGSEYILHLLNNGDSFNDIAALENGFNPATATALSETICWQIPVHMIQTMLQANPQSAQAAIRLLTQRVSTLVLKLESLALYSVRSRLARFLLEQAETPVLEGSVTRVAIAAHLATTPETISRVLRSLENSGAIQFNRHRIEIIDITILKAVAFMDSS